MKCQFIQTKEFKKSYKKLFKHNKELQIKIVKILLKMENDPFYPSLKTHQVSLTKYDKKVWSSSITGDIRIIWTFDNENNLIILLLNIGGHSGTNSVY